MNEQLLKDFLATAKKDNYNWDVILPKFPELKDYDLQLLKDYAATAKKDNYDYSIINPKFPEFNLEEQEGGKPVNFTEGSGEQQEQPTEPLEKPIVDVDRFDVPETDEYLSGAREAAAKKLKETEELLVSADIPDLPKHVIDYPSYNVEQLDSALTDIGKREKQTNFILSTRGLTQPQRTEAKKQIERLEEERAAAIVYKAEKTNDYSLVGDAVQAVKDVGYSSAIGKKLRPEVYKLESRVSEDIFKEIEGVDIYDLTEIDFNGIRRADVDKVADLADKVAESIADGNPGVRQIAYERILNEAEEYERTKKIKEKIESDTETQDIFSKYRNEALSEFESTNDDGIKYRAELVSTVDSINNNAQSRLNKLVLDYNSDVDLYKQELISQVQQGIITNKEANKKLKDYNIQLYSELESSNNLVIENNKKDIEEVSKEYYKKIEGGFNQFLLDNPMDPSDVEKLQASMKKIYEEVDEGEFAYLKAKENLQSLRFGGATSLVASLGKSYYADLGRAVSSKGTFFNQPWMTELGDEMMTSFSVADERVEDWSDLANVPAVVKSVGRLAGSATTSIAVGAITSAATAGLGTIPAMAAVATASGVTESIDMAGGIKRDIIRETGSLLKGEQGAEAMWKAQMGNWWTYLFDGLPYVGKALRGVSSKAAKIGIVGLESSATETVQETRQTAQEQKIMESVRSGEEISARGFGELITPGLVKSTFLEVAPGSFFLGGSTRAVTEFMMDEKADKLAKEIIVKTRAGLVDNTDSFIRQKIFASMNQFGKNFTNSWLATLQKNGAITEEELGKLYTYSKTAEGFLRNVEGLNLTEEQMNTYFALSNRANELYDKAESITDDKVTRATLTEQANALKKNAQDFLNNPETGGSFVSVKIGKSPAIIMNEEQAIEFVTNNPYVVLPESEVDIVARNADEFGGILEQMANGVEAATEAKLKDVETAAQRLANRTKEQKNLFGDQHTDKKLPYGAADISDITTTDKNGVTTATYVNPETNSVDVIITATNKGNFVGYTRVYENGKPTDMFTAKMQASESGKFKNIITSAENALPDNVEVVETSTISTGGLKSYNKSRLVEKVDEDGNVVTRPTKYSDATKESVKEKGEAAYKPFKTTDKSAAEAEIAKIKEAYPGINTKIIETKVPPLPPQPGKKSGKKAPNQYSISIDLPVLVKPEGMKNLAPVTEVAATTQQASEVAKEAPIVTDDAGKAITVYRGGKPASGVQFYTDDQKLAEDIGKAKDEGVQKATVRMSNPWTPESLDVNNAPQWMKDWVRSREEFTTVDEETMAAEEIPMEQAIQEIKDMRLSFRDVGLWQSFVNETLKHHDGIIAFDPSEDMATDKKIYITRSPEQVVTEDITEDKKEVTNAEKTKIAEGIGKVRKVKPKNIKGLLDVMGGVFGLNKTQSESAAVVGDVLVETMAKRAGVSKEEMYQRIAYQKAQKAPDGSLKQEAPIFKSTAQEGIGKIQQKAATPEQWVKMITDKGGKGTTQELEWIGLQDYLNEWKKENNAKSVPREVVEQYINDNQIEIVEVKSPTNESIGKSDYTGYTLEGGENYREVLLTLPQEKPASEYKSSHWDETNIVAHLRINERTLPNGERVMFIEEVQSDWAQEGKKEGFFTENQKENREEYANDALRYGELIKKNNKEREILKNNKELVASVSVMNESGITSWTGIEDFGKENTVFTNGNNIPRVKEDLVDYKDLPKEYRDAYEKRKKITSEYHKTSEEINSLESKYGTVLNDFGDDILKQPDDLLDAGSVPDMPYKKTDQWVGMAMRRAMQMASQEGFDRVAWVTGEQSADRYDLSKQVDAIKYTKEGGKYNIIAENNGVDQITKNNLSESELESAVGKEVAQKIVNGEGDSELNFGFKTLTGQDLKVGGEGMKAFYNSILPKVAKKEAQRFDKKANIEVVDFGDNTSKVVVDVQRDGSIRLINENGGFIAEYNKNQFKEAYKEADRLNERIDSSQVVGKQLSIPITPEMRMNLNSAVPLFQKEQGAMTAADGQYVIYALTDPNVSTPLHELAHVYEHYLTDDEIAVIERWGGHKAGTVEFSEKFARGFEKFLAGGKVKNPRLQKIFENFKKWLTEIYNGIKGSEIDIQLNDKMEAIYNDMLGVEETSVEAPVKETVTRKQRRKKPKSKVKDAFEWGMQKGVPAIAVKNHLIKLGYTEEEITSGAYDAEKIWNKDGKKIVKWFDYGRRAALSARKFRPQTMFLAAEAMESSISAELRQAKMMVENLNRAINKYKSQDKRDELIDAVDEFMRDAEERDFWRNELPDDIAQIAEAMRVHIDSLSLKLVDSGVIKAESSRENILGNIGVYMNRSFEIFDNENWKEEVSEQVITAAQNYLREAYYNSLSGISELDQQLKDGKITESEYNRRKNRILSNKASVKEIMDRDNVSEDEALTMHVDDVIDSILSKKDVNEYILFAQPKVGKKDLSSLKRRKDIPPAIRALMGEYTDPGYNYAMSIFKIANLVENQKYLTKIRDAGLGVWLFEKEAGKKIPEGYEKITFEGDASMNPLDGLYAPKEVAKAFNDTELNKIIAGVPKIGRLYGYWLKGVGAVKYNKTILSYGTHAKNVIGNMYFMAQNGYLDPREYQQPFIALVKQFSGKELTAEQEAKMDEWVRAGIIGQGATIGEIKSFFEGEDSFEKALTKRIDKKTDNMLSKVRKGVKKFGQKAQEAYQYEDDMFKIVAYEKEKLNYSKILFDGKSYNQLDVSQQSTVNDYVAEIIKNILPNYGRIGGLGKGLKAIPITGTFISFQIEAYRTAYNTVALAIQEIKGDIPGISETGKKLVQKRGVMRLISIVGFQAFKYGLISLLGIPLIPGDDDDEDGLSEKIRTLLPFWDTNSDISVQEVKPNGNFTYVSISASDPYGSIFKVVNATKNFTKTREGFSEIFGELAGPFVSEDILLNTLMNIKNNENDYGGKIVRNTDTPFEASAKIALQLGKTFEPGAITSTRKIIQSENKLNEALGQFTGFKLHEVKSLEQAGFKFGDIQKKAQESKSAYNSIKYNMDDYETQEDINKVIRASKKAMDEDYQEAVKLYQALISLGVSDRDVKKKMYDYRISAKMRSQIARNSVDVKLNPIKK